VGSTLDPFREKIDRLITMPGISDVTAQVIVSEIGVDMSRFPTAGHLISWAGLCPRNDESAGKRRSTLRDNVDYRDLGTDYFDRTDRSRQADRLVKRLGALGYAVELKAVA
jgi:transposase